jgi:predicted AlkP superfamily phosphohydrolase/phosphomutase
VLAERLRLLEHALANYDDGLLFFYFSSTDLQAHMFWWDADEPHPTRSPEDARKYMGVVEDLYARIDGVIGRIVKEHGRDATILVLSDHGFCNFRRQVNLNGWLRANGYLGPPDAQVLAPAPGSIATDWARTRAYGLGLNGLYVNLQGREQHGVVEPGARAALVAELREKLLALRDPQNGEPAIVSLDAAEEVYAGPFLARAPDLIVGYRRGYRCSWATALGQGLDEPVFSDNREAWSADHCMAARELPGVLFSNRPLRASAPTLIDLAPTILTAFAVPVPAALRGRNVL